LSLLIKKELELKGFQVFLTRETDVDVSLENRVKTSSDNKCDLFLSIHHNAIPDDLDPLDHEGISVHYYYEHSKTLAKELSAAMAKAMMLQDNSAIQQNLYVTRENKHSKAVLLECGYLIHPKESETLVKPEFQTKFARELAEFLSKFLKNS
jgi:N-acetylmuramoyl-L-alanine amidase